MFKQFIDKIPGADLFLVTSLLMFLVFFLTVGVYLYIMDQQHLHEMSQMPLNDQPKTGS